MDKNWKSYMFHSFNKLPQGLAISCYVFNEINNMVTLVNTFTCEQAFNLIMGRVMTSFDLKKRVHMGMQKI